MMEDDNEQTNPAANADPATPAAMAPAYYGSYEQNARAQAIQIAHDREIAPEQVVARADAYAKFIVG